MLDKSQKNRDYFLPKSNLFSKFYSIATPSPMMTDRFLYYLMLYKTNHKVGPKNVSIFVATKSNISSVRPGYIPTQNPLFITSSVCVR